MGEFEQYCKDNNIPLYVLPPKSPRYNGKDKRVNRIYKYEFYSVYEYFYNHFRHHRALNNLTPMEYYNKMINNNKAA